MKTVHLKHFTNTYHHQGIYCTVTLLMQYCYGTLPKIDQKDGIIGRVPVIVYCTLKRVKIPLAILHISAIILDSA